MRQRIAEFLRSRRLGATNGEISDATGIGRARVYQLTQAMLASGEVRGRRLALGGIWHFVWREMPDG